MSITVRDCLTLPSLRDAKVVAGHAGLDQYVAYVDVLEYAKVFAMTDQLFLNNGLIITAFTSVKDDVEAQCKAIRRLHEVGEVGIILYYVGIYMTCVDQRLIDIANELSFPVIVMPENSYSLRYSEVSVEIMQRIFEERNNVERFVPDIIRQISKMRERQRNIGSILRLVSDRCHYSFLLLNQDGRQCSMATWPMTIDSELLATVYELVEAQEMYPYTFFWNDCGYTICKNSFKTQLNEEFYIFTLAASDSINENAIAQVVEILQSSSEIWNIDLRRTVQDDLVRMILNEQNGEAHRVAKALHVDLKPMRIMWVISPLPAKREAYSSEIGSKIKYELKEYLKDYQKKCIVDTFDSSVVAFMEDSKHLELDRELDQSFIDFLSERHPDMALVWCGGLDTVKDAQLVYIQFEEHFDTACLIYPNKMVFTQRELNFASNCYEIAHGDLTIRNKLLLTLRPLQDSRDAQDMLETLSTYLIDTDKNIVKTSKILHLHESTVKYRLNKIKLKLGYDIAEMPGMYTLYQALAVNRLLGDGYR